MSIFSTTRCALQTFFSPKSRKISRACNNRKYSNKTLESCCFMQDIKMYEFPILPFEPSFIPNVFEYHKIGIGHFLWFSMIFIKRIFLTFDKIIFNMTTTKHICLNDVHFFLIENKLWYVLCFCERRKIQPPLWSFGRSRPYKVFIKPFWQGKNLHSNNTIQLHVLITCCVLILYSHQEHWKYIQCKNRAFIWQRVVNASSEG